MNASLKALLNEQYKLVAELREENKKLKEELKETEDTLFHRDGVLSIMYDLVRSGRDEYDIVTMISSVIDDECWNYDELNEIQKENVKRFWNRDF